VIRDRICEWYATCSYVGYLPFAPGTWGSLFACALVYFYPSLTNPLVIVLITAAGIVASERARGDETDPGRVVIDELVGVLVTMAGHDISVGGLAKGFILFRAFDILKPYPIRKLERLPGGYGIIADDVLAGFFANAAFIIWGRLI
jgi:phosphatidylglycerophosphatase A